MITLITQYDMYCAATIRNTEVLTGEKAFRDRYLLYLHSRPLHYPCREALLMQICNQIIPTEPYRFTAWGCPVYPR